MKKLKKTFPYLIITILSITSLVYYIRSEKYKSRYKKSAEKLSHVTLSTPYLSKKLQRVQFANLPPVEYEKIFDRSLLQTTNIQSKKEFIQKVFNHYKKHKKHLAKTWKIEEGPLLKTFFFMNIVSRLWGYGNYHLENKKKPGCVSANERTQFKNQKIQGIQTYLQSDIGCCTDYVAIMKLLLDASNIKNRITTLAPGWHVFNEVYFNNSWHVADANLNIFYYQSWEEMKSHKDRPIKMTMFPHQNLVASSGPTFYRPEMFYYRVINIFWILYDLSMTVKYSEEPII